MNNYYNQYENSLLARLLYSDRLLIVTGAIIFPLLALGVASKLVDIEPVTMFVLLVLGFLSGICLIKNLMYSPLVSYLIIQLMFIGIFFNETIRATAGINLKLHAIALGLSVLTASYYLFKNFDQIWKNFSIFRFLFLFFIANIFYLLFYHSDFRLSAVSAGYPIAFASDFSDENASFIMFLDSLCPLVSVIIPLVALLKVKSENDFSKKLNRIILYFSCGTLFYLICSVLNGFNFRVPGFGIFITAFLFVFLGFKLYRDNLKNKENPFIDRILSLLILIDLIIILIVINKTGLLGFIVSLILFFSLCIFCKIKMPFLSFNINKNNLFSLKTILYSVLILGLIGILTTSFADVINDKIQYFSEGYSSLSTFKRRQTNWYYFIQNWIEQLSMFTAMFGFGTGASRESIFYISAMQSNNNLVQTTHNHYMDMFYDYGMVALLYFSAIFSVFINNIKNIINKSTSENLKLFSIISASILTFYLIYHMADGVRVTNAIILFSVLGLLEAVKYNFREKSA